MGSTFTVFPTIVDPHGQHVVALAVDVGREVKSHGHHSILMVSEVMPVEVEVGSMAHTLELHEHLAAALLLGQAEVLAVPHHGVGKLVDGQAVSLILVEGARQRDGLPPFLGVFRRFGSGVVAYAVSPIQGKVVAGSAPCCQGNHE